MSSGATMEEVIAALEDAERYPDGPLEIVPIRCASRYYGDMINGRYLKVPCRGAYCKISGRRHTDHLFDTITGRYRTVDDEARVMHSRPRRNAKAERE